MVLCHNLMWLESVNLQYCVQYLLWTLTNMSLLNPYFSGSCILAVAVVRNDSTLDMRSLKGSRSCHSGARWTAGWSLPLGHLLSRNLLPWGEDEPLSQGDPAYHD